MNVRRVADAEAVARAAAGEIAAAAARSVRERGAFTLVLAGGSTPRRTYQLLADGGAPFRDAVPWEQVHLFFGDERHVPPDHPDSNYRMAREALLARVRPGSVHRVRGELPDAAAAAAEYEADLARFFGVEPPRAAPPRLDLVLLGLGADGHTASLFPGRAALREESRWAVATAGPGPGVDRVTLTLPVLGRARAVLFLVSGPAKAEALAAVAAASGAGDDPPAARVRPEVPPLWIVDAAAARGLPS